MTTRGAQRSAAGAASLEDLTPEAVAQVVAAGGHPCVSVIVPTTAAPRMPASDRDRVLRCLDRARRLLVDEGVDGDRVLRELRRLAELAGSSRSGHALALLVSDRVSRAWVLPVTVHEKVVVEPTFATRDLLRALHRTPPHLVVRVDGFGARVFWVSGRVTLLETVERLPLRRPLPLAPGGDDERAEEVADLLARIEGCVGRVREERPGPLVLAGDPDLLVELRTRARWLHRLAGQVDVASADAPDDLFRASALCVEDYLQRRGQHAVEELRAAAAEDSDRVVAGLEECQAAVRLGVPGVLVVEHGYVHPGAGDDRGQAPRHDLVDDLLEVALASGNLIAFVEDAQLHEFGGIALLRP